MILGSPGRSLHTSDHPSMGIAHSPPFRGFGVGELLQIKKTIIIDGLSSSGWGQRSRTSISKFRVCCPAIRRAPSTQALSYHISTGFDKLRNGKTTLECCSCVASKQQRRQTKSASITTTTTVTVTAPTTASMMVTPQIPPRPLMPPTTTTAAPSSPPTAAAIP